MFSDVQQSYHPYPHAFRNPDDIVHARPPVSPSLLPRKYPYDDTSSSRFARDLLRGVATDAQHNPRPGREAFTVSIIGSPMDAAADRFGPLECDTFSDISGSMPALERRRTGSSSVKFESTDHNNAGSSVDGSEAGSPASPTRLATLALDEHAATRADGPSADGKRRGNKTRVPAWSELKTKAGKERKRLPLACIACRRKKIRCSGEKPACKHCLRSRIPCVYKVTTRKAAPRTDYMTMLDKRLKRMEERVIKIIPDAEPAKMASIGRSSVKPAPAAAAAAAATKSAGTKKRAAEDAFGSEIDEWLQGAATAEFHHISTREQHENKLLTEGSDSLPPREIQEHLAETFFDYVYGQSYHLLHKPSFMRRLRAGTIPPVLILAVCAVSARFSTHPQVNNEPAFLRGEEWAKPARDIALKRYDEPNITILTVLLILGLHEFGTCQGGRSWMLGGMAMRMAHALQLHRELDYDPLGKKQGKTSELSFTDREIRRRTMWACFMMDRFNSSGTERPMLAIEDNIEVQLPINESQYQMEIPGPTENLDGSVSNTVSPGSGQVSRAQDNMGVAAYLIRVIALWGRVIRYLNLGGRKKDPHPIWHPDSHFSELKRLVEDFQEKLPARLRYSAETLQNHAAEKLANQFLFMHICIRQMVLFLHKFAIPMKPGGITNLPADMPKDFIREAGRLAVEAAGKISELIDKSISHLVVAPFVGYCAFLSSTVHVWGIFSKNAQLEASSKRHLACNVKYLSRMKVYWGVLYHMADNLRTIYRQYADAALRGPAAGEGDVDSSQDGNIFEYGGWFDAYPHGVSQADYQEPAASESTPQADEAVFSQKSDLQTVEEFFNTLTPPPPSAAHRHRKVRTQSSSSQQARRQHQGQVYGHPTHQGSPTGPALMSENWPTGIQAHHMPAHHNNDDDNSDGALLAISPTQQQPPPQHSLQQQQQIHQHQQHLQSQQQHPLQSQLPQHQYVQPLAQQQSISAHRPSFDATAAADQAHAQAIARAHAQVHLDPSPYNQVFSNAPVQPSSSPYGTGSIHDLDRQLVFGAYASDTGVHMGTTGTGWDDDFSMADVAGAMADGTKRSGSAGALINSGGGSGGGSVGEVCADASSAWFMPFNLAPPDVGIEGQASGYAVGGFVGDMDGAE